jgi:subtilisin family serine protease
LSGNIFVVGTTDNNTSNNYDVILLKYNNTGNLQWSASFNSIYNKNDIATALKIDDNGNIYICASSESTLNQNDFLILKYSFNGIMQWSNRYDYAALGEFPIAIDIDVNNNIFITGASASAINNWDYTIAKYDTAGTFIGDVRNALPGVGFDQPMAFKEDVNNNIYITGRSSSDGINYDIKTVKLNSNYIVQWSAILDLAGKEDFGNSIDIDANGNVYVGGFATKSNNIKELIAVKYDTSGIEQWRHEQSSINVTGHALIKDIYVTAIGEVYFTAEEKGINNSKDIIVTKLKSTGQIAWSKKLDEISDQRPTNINISNDGSIYVTSLKDSILNSYEIVKYKELAQNQNVVLNTNGEPIFKENELIVRFDPSALNLAIINDSSSTRQTEFGTLDEFLKPVALGKFNNAFIDLCNAEPQDSLGNPCKINAIKVFKQLKSTYITTTNRLGETIKIPNFWTTLLLEFPSSISIEAAYHRLKTLPDVVIYSEPNLIASTSVGCDDPNYTQQFSLYPNLNYPNADINVEEAWDIIPSGGASTVKAGVFDTGLDWTHPDFGYDGTNPSSSKVVDGWDFQNNHNTKATIYGDDGGHGTPCGGIIGAIRNNNAGVAGIAGGDENGSPGLTDKGVALYSMRILEPFTSTFNYIYDAIVISSIDTSSIYYAFGLNLASNSWGINATDLDWFTGSNLTLLKEATHFANRANVTFIAARGNDGLDNLEYPAIIDDDWILNVGGTGNDGEYINGSNGEFVANYGHNVDVAAPSTINMVSTLSNYGFYSNFNGTSAATPHVAGVVGLLMSYLNSPIPAYQNLAPEDCENIVQLSATDVGTLNEDIYTGWGRLNAGKAMRLVEQPWNGVKHFGTNSFSAHTKSISLFATNDTIKLIEQYQSDSNNWFAKGKYVINTYKANATVAHAIGATDTIISSWPRPSSSTVLEGIVGDSLLPRQRVTINSVSNTNCSMSGYIYEVFDTLGNPLGWWPSDTTSSNIKFEYTLLAHNTLAPTKQESKNISWLKLFPNPANTDQTILLHANTNEDILINLYDSQGRNLQTIYKGKSIVGDNIIKSDINKLNPAIYFYEVKFGNNIEHLRFIKQ